MSVLVNYDFLTRYGGSYAKTMVYHKAWAHSDVKHRLCRNVCPKI